VHEASLKTDRLLAQKQLMSASKKSGQLTCCETGQFYLLLTEEKKIDQIKKIDKI